MGMNSALKARIKQAKGKSKKAAFLRKKTKDLRDNKKGNK
jgi:hypothetical protein